MRLQALDLSACYLQGSADGFLIAGWTALTSLFLRSFTRADDNMCLALQLPALQVVSITDFRHRGGLLKLNQLSGSCLQISCLELECSLAQPSKASEQSSLLNLSRLADLHIIDRSHHAKMDLGLPPSLTRLQVRGHQCDGHFRMDLFWVLLQAVKCIRRGGQLHTLDITMTEASFQPAQWGATLEQQFRHLGGQLNSLKELEVSGGEDPLLSAILAAASSAPNLTRLKFSTSCNELPPICSASLESIVVVYCDDSDNSSLAPPPPVLLTLLPGCIRLQEVLVQHRARPPEEGSVVSICCCSSHPSCIVPLHVGAGLGSKVGIQLLLVAPSMQAMRGYIVMFTCHAAGPKQPLKWDHVVCPIFSGMDV